MQFKLGLKMAQTIREGVQMHFISSVLFCVFTFIFFSHAHASIFQVTGDSEFIATGKPSALKIRGQGSGVTGQLKVEGTKVTGDFNFPLNQFGTGIGLRDKHMKEKYLETGKYPLAHLVIDQVQVSKNIEANGFRQKQVPFSGNLTLHGITHSVSGTMDVSTADSATKGDVQFELKIADYNIQVPKYLGVTVADNVQIIVHAEATKQKDK
jgi:polyisoprenoid-binding protein YceI